MKKLLLLIFASQAFCFVSAQTTSFENFKIVEQELIYQKVFQMDSASIPKLEKYYKTLPYITNVLATSDGLQLEVTDITVDYKKFEFTQVGTPPIMQTGKFSGEVSIGVKDGKYRVTFKSIKMTGDMGYKRITEKDNLTTYACRNSGTIISQDWCRPNMLGLLDKVFTDKFEFKKGKDDW